MHQTYAPDTTETTTVKNVLKLPQCSKYQYRHKAQNTTTTRVIIHVRIHDNKQNNRLDNRQSRKEIHQQHQKIKKTNAFTMTNFLACTNRFCITSNSNCALGRALRVPPRARRMHSRSEYGAGDGRPLEQGQEVDDHQHPFYLRRY